jgi:protein-S-isoprenylcysteine O-methyltransferase Ste14
MALGNADLAGKVAFYGLIVCWWLFALTFWLRKRPPRAREAKRDLKSYFGLLLQALGYFVVSVGPLRHGRFSPADLRPQWLAWTIAVLIVAIAAASVVLVNWAARRLGKQWSLGARLVEDHALIEDGPYRFVRNPIYTGMFGLLIATGLATARWPALLIAVVLFGIGTSIRVRIEERLLREAFGARFDDYASRVRALIPWIY